jgi:NRPS condensation-like uncharacterized protein
MDKKRKGYNTTLEIDLMKKIRHLAVEHDVNVNDLIEEALADLLKKYKTTSPKKLKS